MGTPTRSAAIWASAVSIPCPMETTPDDTTTDPSCSIRRIAVS